jgi:hypothetical protein
MSSARDTAAAAVLPGMLSTQLSPLSLMELLPRLPAGGAVIYCVNSTAAGSHELIVDNINDCNTKFLSFVDAGKPTVGISVQRYTP